MFLNKLKGLNTVHSYGTLIYMYILAPDVFYQWHPYNPELDFQIYTVHLGLTRPT